MTTDHDEIIYCENCKFFEAEKYCSHWISRHGVFIKAQDARKSILCGPGASMFRQKSKPLIPATINWFLNIVNQIRKERQ